MGINISDINFAKRSLRVVGKGNKERIVYLNDLCINTIKDYLEVRPMDGVLQADKDALFLSRYLRRISNRMVELLAKKYFKNAGIDEKILKFFERNIESFLSFDSDVVQHEIIAVESERSWQRGSGR